MKVGIVVRRESNEAADLAIVAAKHCASLGMQVFTENESAAALGIPAGGERSELVRSVNLVIALGGDGTILSVARHIGNNDPLLIGVKFGTLGFLTETKPNELLHAIDEIHQGKVKFREREMLYGELTRADNVVVASQALNDVVISRCSDRLVELSLRVDNSNPIRIRADGMILATPTGSTAYSLAAGGSVVDPCLSAILITPVCPHSLTVRPLIISSSSMLSVSCLSASAPAVATFDGQISCEIRPGDELKITRARHRARLLCSGSHGYYDVLHSKLHWALENRTD